jgi:transposase
VWLRNQKERIVTQALVIGVDMAKKDFAASSRVETVELVLGKFVNEASGYRALQAQLDRQCAAHGLTQIHLIIEATGGYEAALVAYAYEQQWLVSMPNPKQVRDWAKGVGYRVKTAPGGHPVDARMLAHYGVERHPPVPPQLALEVSHLDSLLKRRLDLEQALQKEQTRLAELTGGCPPGAGIAPQVEESLQQVIEALTKALAELQHAIDDLCQTHEPFRVNLPRLLALPGIGPKVVLPLLVKLFQWQTWTHDQGNTKRLVAYIGLDPQPYESGRSVHKHPAISKMGDKELRRLLYMGALGGVRGNNPLRDFYQRLVGRGKAKKVALIAAARKILVWAGIIFTRQIDWNPDLHQFGS